MRCTDNRYSAERQQFDLAVRLIQHEARTHIISQCTGFSQDRIRKLYTSYFRFGGQPSVRRQRGKSPTNIGFLVRNAATQSQSSTLAGLFTLFGLMTISRTLETGRRNAENDLAFGQHFCQAYETYLHLHPETDVSFEHAWNLFHALTERLELVLADCSRCGNIYVQDALALDRGRCPACRVRSKKDDTFQPAGAAPC
ncbi:MAG: hypothetical protein ACR2QU_02650 [Gammaproteobacteria bacterium]